ncbi:MAG TPA: phosphotransferase [Dissulfurispiraceae bacterium]|nr:phosphotransferase [Dissulfurispiraceae bacterium]
MTDDLRCFVLAAGRGERLRPITDHIPKPLLPILGKPLIELIIGRLLALRPEGMAMNVHHRREVFEEWLKRYDPAGAITVFPEDPILNTGGALKNAASFLRHGPFLVHNGDILTDMDLDLLVTAHLSSKNLATLAVRDVPMINNLALDHGGMLVGARDAGPLQREHARRAFTGVAVYDPAFLDLLPDGPSDVVLAWKHAVAEGLPICTHDVSGCTWSDIGSPAAYASALFQRLQSLGESVYIDQAVGGCSGARFEGRVVIEGTHHLPANIHLHDCVVLPGADLQDIGHHAFCILGPGFTVPFETGLSVPEPVPLGVGGSARRYFRVMSDGSTAVLMQCPENDPDFLRHLALTRHFRKLGVPVPDLIGEKQESLEAIFEDLGDVSLYTWLKCPRCSGDIEDAYGRVLEGLVQMHHDAMQSAGECPELTERVFDYEHLRWETSYFMDRFVSQVREVSAGDRQRLDEEFHRLASLVDSFEKTVVHRDFQSQNVMITAGDIPRFIDYQGARIGPPAYDVASMLWDPYYRIEDALRERLLGQYEDMMTERSERFSRETFRASLLPCRLQRHMQALGAYGFLAMVKGKRYFLKYVPEGLRLLKEETLLTPETYPALFSLVSAL